MISSTQTRVPQTPCRWCTWRPRLSLVSGACLLAVLLLTSCSAASTSTPPHTLHATPTPTVGGPTPVMVGGPTPVTAALAPPPQNCALTPPPSQQPLGSSGPLVGGGEFWVRAGYMDIVHLGPTGYQQWPQWKWVVEVGPNYAHPVTLELRNLQTGALAWWSATPPSPATQSLVLDPRLDTEDVGAVSWLAAIPHGDSAPGWKEWGIFPVFSVAGCYTLEARWAGGSWRSIIAVGN
jgi:hypothetical protein